MKKSMNKRIALIIATAISLGQLPVSSIYADEIIKENIAIENDDVAEIVEEAKTYNQSYNEHDSNSWTRLQGDGTIRENFDYIDEENNVNGVLEIKRGTSDNKLVFVEDQSPSLEDFELETRFQLNPSEEDEGTGRFGLVFRGTSASSYGFVGYNNGGKWLIETATAWKDDINGPTIEAGEWVTMKVKAEGNKLTLTINGEEIFSDVVTLDGYPSEAGKFGFRTWYDNKDVNVDYMNITEIVKEASPVETIEEVTVDTLVGTEPSLPYRVGVTYEDGTVGEHIVVWDYINPELFEEVGTFTVEGTLKNTAEGTKKATATVTVREKIEYATDFETAETSGDWKLLQGTGTPSVVDGAVVVPMNGVSTAVDNASPNIKDLVYEADFTTSSDDGRIGLAFRVKDANNWGSVCYDAGNWVWRASVDGTGTWGSFGSSKALEANTQYKIKMSVEGNEMKLWLDGELIGTVSSDTIPKEAGKIGLSGWFGNKNVTLDNIVVEEITDDNGVGKLPEVESQNIESQSMIVELDNTFPRVIGYTWKDDATTLDGQVDRFNQIDIDGEKYTPEVSFEVVDNKGVYTMTIKELDVTMTSTISVDGNKVRLEITDIQENGSHRVKKVSIPGQAFATVSSADNGAMASVLSSGAWHEIHDEIATVDELDPGVKSKTYGFLNNDSFAVTMNNNTVEFSNRISFTTKNRNGYKTTAIGNSTWTYREVDDNSLRYYSHEEDLWSEAIITKDMNGDGVIDWQDAAIEYRNAMEVPMGGEDIKNSVSHVAFNIGFTQNPFLRTLDTVKKIYNYTDGFGQMVLHKGYQGEGHDDTIPDYGGHIGIRQGGVEDFNTLIDEALKYDAKVGVHINATEYQLDAFNYPQNGIVNENAPGWGWLDQSYYVDQRGDITSGELFRRLDMLKDDAPNLGWVYVDVYTGNGWNAHQLGEKLNDLDFAVGTEFHSPLEEHVIWNHWGADPAYPNKGGDSSILRFIANEHRDGFLSEPLLKGNQHMKSGGWGTDHSIEGEGGISMFYNQTLPTKYMQHFEIMKMEEDKITFSDGLVAVKEGENYNYYRNDRLVATTPQSSLNGNQVGKTNLFLPWNPVEEDEKIYHWNPFGTTSTWELPENWANLENVHIYEVNDTGRIEVGTVAVVNGEVSLDVKQNTPYVVTKGEEAIEKMEEWGTGSEIKDPGFDSQEWNIWSKESTEANTNHITFVNELETRRAGNDVVSIANKQGKLTQTMTGLEEGVTYSVSAWVKNDGNRNVTLGVNYGDETVTEYIDRAGKVRQGEGVKWYGDTYVRMEVQFTAPKGVDTAEVYLDAAEGNGTVFVDDFRVWDHPGHTSEEGFVLYEDFENVDEGVTPFYLGEYRGTSNRTHITEKDLYGRQKMNWVIDGRFSLKTNQQSGETGEMLVTDAADLHLEPNTTYELGFIYSLADGAPGYSVNVKSEDGTVTTVALEATGVGAGEYTKAAAKTQTFTTGDAEDYYISIDKGTGYKELILDNLYVKKVTEATDATLDIVNLNTSVNKLPVGVGADYSVIALMSNGQSVDLANAEIEYITSNEGVISIVDGVITGLVDGSTNLTVKVTVDGKTVSSNTTLITVGVGGDIETPETNKEALDAVIAEAKTKVEENYTEATWNAFKDALKEAKKVSANADATQEEIDSAKEALQTAMDNLETESEVEGDFLSVTGPNEVLRFTDADFTVKVGEDVDTVRVTFFWNENGTKKEYVEYYDVKDSEFVINRKMRFSYDYDVEFTPIVNGKPVNDKSQNLDLNVIERTEESVFTSITGNGEVDSTNVEELNDVVTFEIETTLDVDRIRFVFETSDNYTEFYDADKNAKEVDGKLVWTIERPIRTYKDPHQLVISAMNENNVMTSSDFEITIGK